MKKTLLSLITIVALSTTGVNAQNKNIEVVANTETTHATYTEARHSSYTRNYRDTIISASAVKNHYSVNEPIEIKLELKRDAYIYFWTVSHDGKGYLILPNNFESFNRYTKKETHIVPKSSAEYEFVSDRAGVEKIYLLATDKKISSDRMSRIFSEKVGGVIPKASAKSISNFMTKDIQVIAKENNLNYDLVDFSIRVYEKTSNNMTSFH